MARRTAAILFVLGSLPCSPLGLPRGMFGISPFQVTWSMSTAVGLPLCVPWPLPSSRGHTNPHHPGRPTNDYHTTGLVQCNQLIDKLCQLDKRISPLLRMTGTEREVVISAVVFVAAITCSSGDESVLLHQSRTRWPG